MISIIRLYNGYTIKDEAIVDCCLKSNLFNIEYIEHNFNIDYDTIEELTINNNGVLTLNDTYSSKKEKSYPIFEKYEDAENFATTFKLLIKFDK